MNTAITSEVTPVVWNGDWADGHVTMIDQRRLPTTEIHHTWTTCAEVAQSIRGMIIRGAPAIGIAAGYGVVLGVRQAIAEGRNPTEEMPALMEMLSNTRPTAVNLFWALRRMEALAQAEAALAHSDPEAFADRILQEAKAIHDEDIANNLAMGRHGAELVPHGARILTHCNTGALATGGYGTALGVIRTAHAQGKVSMVYADETRPYLQGARLTCWELMKDNIETTLITDSMAGHFMQRGEVDLVIVGTDRTVANGDVANKIGTYSLAVLCKHHGIPFYVAAPLSTVDLDTPNGDGITIEERSAREVTHMGQHAIAPEGVHVRHPAFDVTPAALVTGIITERGVAQAPYSESLASLVQ
ncbi:MAG: S-methyl-5-thioribose-1-phosphate isomerase [Myxococcota bacterium]